MKNIQAIYLQAKTESKDLSPEDFISKLPQETQIDLLQDEQSIE
jgi:hypothetical protein